MTDGLAILFGVALGGKLVNDYEFSDHMSEGLEASCQVLGICLRQ